MKQLTLTIAIAFAAIAAQAQDFKATLQKTFTAFDTTQSLEVKVEQSNKLSLIAKKWSSEWLAHYYASFSKAVISYRETDEAKRDAYLDEAEKERDEALALLKKDNDETYVLAAMIANARLAVKPQARYMKYGKIFSDNLESAKELNPDNPRIYYLQGLAKYHTPKMFGGGKKAALPYFEKANGLYAKETAEDVSKPYWGKQTNAYFLGESKGEEKE